MCDVKVEVTKNKKIQRRKELVIYLSGLFRARILCCVRSALLFKAIYCQRSIVFGRQ